jgi:hypothetical protein
MTGENHDAGDEARDWATVLAAWEDEAVHRAYLSRCQDLEALARAGGRYREALDARPGDAVAARWRDEVIRRATVAGLASIPREAPAASRVPVWLRVAALGVLGAAALGLAVALFRMLSSWPVSWPMERP